MKYRIVRHCWQGAYITDDMNYYTVEERGITIISAIKRLFQVNKTWYDWTPLKDSGRPIRFQTYMDAYHCVLRVMSGDGVGDWKEEIVTSNTF